MDAQPLYDLAPLAQLMLLGTVIALGPLAWVGWRNRGGHGGRRLQALTVLTLFLTFDLVLFGAFTRLTDSGLGCPDWPGCYGSASSTRPPTRCSVTMAGNSFIVTVKAPKAPCRHTQNSVKVGHQGLMGGSATPCRLACRRCTQDDTVITMMSTPTPVAR